MFVRTFQLLWALEKVDEFKFISEEIWTTIYYEETFPHVSFLLKYNSNFFGKKKNKTYINSITLEWETKKNFIEEKTFQKVSQISSLKQNQYKIHFIFHFT